MSDVTPAILKLATRDRKFRRLLAAEIKRPMTASEKKFTGDAVIAYSYEYVKTSLNDALNEAKTSLKSFTMSKKGGNTLAVSGESEDGRTFEGIATSGLGDALTISVEITLKGDPQIAPMPKQVKRAHAALKAAMGQAAQIEGSERKGRRLLDVVRPPVEMMDAWESGQAFDKSWLKSSLARLSRHFEQYEILENRNELWYPVVREARIACKSAARAIK